jgi:lactam utilization protein B
VRTLEAEAPGLSPPRRARELAWRCAHEDELQAYAGQWVVLEGEQIVAHGENPAGAVEQARSQGIRVPYVFYVEEYRPGVVLIGL